VPSLPFFVVPAVCRVPRERAPGGALGSLPTSAQTSLAASCPPLRQTAEPSQAGPAPAGGAQRPKASDIVCPTGKQLSRKGTVPMTIRTPRCAAGMLGVALLVCLPGVALIQIRL
jgi:hypothetical protein